MTKDIKLKRVVIKEELVELTGNYKLALVLNQLLYWTERVGSKRYKLFAKEEINREINDTNNLKGGWVYKKAEELADELMIGVTPETVRNWLKELESQGYILSRKNPHEKWDHTKQYRLDLLKIQFDLQELGYNLEGYINIFKNKKKSLLSPKSPNRNNLDSNQNNYDSNLNNFGSNLNNYGTITEITTESTTKKEEEEGENFKNKISQKTLSLFRQVYGENMKSYQLRLIQKYDFSEEIIQKALELAGSHNAQTLQYLLDILTDWKNEGIKSLKDVENKIERIKYPEKYYEKETERRYR